MSTDKTGKPPRPAKIAAREAALRDNLMKRKQQQRARQQPNPATHTKDDK